MADWALTHNFPRLAGSHALARKLADGLREVGCDIISPVDTNMVFFDPVPLGLTVQQIIDALAALPDPITINSNRCVLDYQTAPEAVDDFVAEVKRLAEAVPADQRPESGGPRKKAKLGYA
jgi:threonine aldolase